MNVPCPYRPTYNEKTKLLEYFHVNIYANLCNMADLCPIDDCQYWDLSNSATKKFMQAQRCERSLEGMLEAKYLKQEFMKKHFDPKTGDATKEIRRVPI